MTKLLDGQEKIIEKLATVSEIVRRHDVETFPEIKETIKEISHATNRMESKQNEDMAKFVEEKERLYTEFKSRIIPLEEDFASRTKVKTEIKGRFSDIIWEGLKNVSYIVVGYIITKIKYLQ
jgi:hypothetical protein